KPPAPPPPDKEVPNDRGATQIGEKAVVAGVVAANRRAGPDPDSRSRQGSDVPAHGALNPARSAGRHDDVTYDFPCQRIGRPSGAGHVTGGRRPAHQKGRRPDASYDEARAT